MKISKNFIQSDKFFHLEKEWKGVKINKLTIISIPGYINRTDSISTSSPAVHVICECGKELITVFYRVKSGRTRSCGCINGNYKEGDESSAYDLMNRYRHSAKKRNLTFNLSYDDFYYIIKQDCHYCGISPKQERKHKGCRQSIIYNGIDRLDSNQGYTLNNCLPCCFTCNRAKLNMTYEEYLEYINRLVEFSPQLKNRDVSVKPKESNFYGNTESTTQAVVFVEHSDCAISRAIMSPRAPEVDSLY